MNARGVGGNSRRGGVRWLGSTLALMLLLLGAASAFSPAATRRSSAPRPGAGRVQIKDVVHARSTWNYGQCTSGRGDRMPATALAAAPPTPGMLAAAGATVSKFYKAFPLAAGFLTAGTKAAVADRLAQYRDACVTKYNFKRNLAMTLYSGLVLGISVELMYNRVFPVLFGTVPSLARTIKMVLFDAFVNAPLLWLPPAYLAQALIYRYPKRDALKKYACDVKENGLLTKYWSLWIPATTINFRFVPPHFRVAFVASISFFWMIILSLVANKSDADECPLEPEPGFVDPRALE